MDHLSQLAEKLGLALQQQKTMLTLAESCTGGLVAQSVTDIAGSSAWFERGFVAYSNQSKMELLAVPESFLTQYGAVSEQVAKAMVVGALENSHAQLAGSITGIAGPTGGTVDKPVGTVCFAWAMQGGLVYADTQYFDGNRQQVRYQSAAFLLQALLDVIAQQ